MADANSRPNFVAVVRSCFHCGRRGHAVKSCPFKPTTRTTRRELTTPSPPPSDDFETLFDDVRVEMRPKDALAPIDDFRRCGLRRLLVESVSRMNFRRPTQIQRYAIPCVKDAQRDLMATAQTGSGKTVAFLLPIVHALLEDGVRLRPGERLQCPEALILAPTRELAQQIQKVCIQICEKSVVRCVAVYGGHPRGDQERALEKGVNVLVATPGRLLDFETRGFINFSRVRFLVLDEADRMLDMGFQDDVDQIVRRPEMPEKRVRRTLMFSATFPRNVQEIAGEYLNEYVFLAVGTVGALSPNIKQYFIEVKGVQEKLNHLMELLQQCDVDDRVLVFTESKKSADFLATYFISEDFMVTSIHGDRIQTQREEALEEFKSGRRNILMATEVAGRGLDIPKVTHVINYDMPRKVEQFVHRVGRTGRIGNKGKATTFYNTERDGGIAEDLVSVLKGAGQDVPDFLEEEAKNPGNFLRRIGISSKNQKANALYGFHEQSSNEDEDDEWD